MTQWIRGLIVVCIGGLSLHAFAGVQQLELRDVLNQTWKREFVEFPFSAPDQQCHVESLVVTGPNGPVAAQFLAPSFVTTDTAFVREARIGFIIDELPALGQQTYTAEFGAQPRRTTVPATDLTITTRADMVEIATEHFGLRVPVGERTGATPQESITPPAPVSALRLGQEPWYGGSRLYGAGEVVAWSSRLTERGPVRARVEQEYRYADGSRLQLVISLLAGDSRALFESRYQGAFDLKRYHKSFATNRIDPTDKAGWSLQFTPARTDLSVLIPWEVSSTREGMLQSGHTRVRGKNMMINLAASTPGLITQLTPWGDWWEDYTQNAWTFYGEGETPVMRVEAVDPGAWVEPAPTGTFRGYGEVIPKWMPLWKEQDGPVHLYVTNVPGERKWLLGSAAPSLNRTLNTVKEYVLDWDSTTQHPHLYTSPDALQRYWNTHAPNSALIEELFKTQIGPGQPNGRSGWVLEAGTACWLLSGGDPEVAKRVKLVAWLHSLLDSPVGYDSLWNTAVICSGYDAVMGSDLVTPEERRLLRAKLALLAYRINDPTHWSIERGYCTANLDMSVSNELNKGMLAATLSDHPMAETWFANTRAMMEYLLSQKLTSHGEWPETTSGYFNVSFTPILTLAIAARNAGLGDFVDDQRTKRAMTFMAKFYAPPDPRGGGAWAPGLSRMTGLGDGAGYRSGLPGVMARAIAASDPELSTALQWVWKRAGYPMNIEHSRMGGFQYIYLDRDLPAKAPNWRTDLYPRVATIFRDRLDTGKEDYLVQVVAPSEPALISEAGGIAHWFAYGVPLLSHFAGRYEFRQEGLANRVILARTGQETPERQRRSSYVMHEHRPWAEDRPGTVQAIVDLPAARYSHAYFPIRGERRLAGSEPFDVPVLPAAGEATAAHLDWHRQLLMVTDGAPDSPRYLVLRDTVNGKQPTRWIMWSTSELLDVPAALRDAEACLSHKPGNSNTPARQLPQGDRYTALGKFGVDLEYFIASPADTPRHTLRWGTGDRLDLYGYMAGYKEYADLLHLQIPGDGAYYVALFPHPRGTAAPSFTTLGEGTIIHIRGDFGDDYCFMSREPASAETDVVAFRGRVALVQQRGDRRIFTLFDRGRIRQGAYALSAEVPVALQIAADRLEVGLHTDAGGQVMITVPGSWRCEQAQVQATALHPGYLLTIPAGLRSVSLVKAP
jgi:hypothetical protein